LENPRKNNHILLPLPPLSIHWLCLIMTDANKPAVLIIGGLGVYFRISPLEDERLTVLFPCLGRG